ncbi:hypothetical protein BKA69DRAFT_235146 [Paraphysoderma sedebokerense]|nr:hypothetical protein BKA69DRAFT_235146 [Paraphysoderma sedebokerense]
MELDKREWSRESERLVTNDEIEGVPILMLANKQDQPNAMNAEDIKEIFNQITSRLGARDSYVLPCSALSGWVWHILLRMLSNTKCRSSFIIFYPFPLSCFEHISDGVKDAVDWLFLRIQRNRQNRPPVLFRRQPDNIIL